jgi:hypothetical protein
MSLLRLFCDVDDFWQAMEQQRQQALPAYVGQKRREPGLCASEIMTILIHFHQTGYRCFKRYYEKHVLKHLRRAYALSRCGRCTGISFVDSTPLRVCHNRRITRHKVFTDRAARGQSSTGWFYGFKLHLVVNDRGDILAFQLTSGNVDDRVPVPKLAAKLFGKLFGDKGYLSTPLFQTLFEQGLQLVTNLRSNMKNKLTPLADKLLLRKRWIIETINDQLKNMSQIEHSRHRSPVNFIVNVLAGLIAYMWQPKKPSLHFTQHQASALSLC